MRKIISSVLALAMLATSAAAFTGESEARSRRHYDNKGYYDHHRRHNNNDDVAAAAIIGLALGAIVIGSLADQNRRTNLNYAYDDRYDRRYDARDAQWQHIRRCEARYRSYDRYSDTFIGRDGRRYYCNL